MNNFFDDDIILIEPEHRYELKSDPDFEFTSVTSLADEYFEPFDSIAIASNLVATNVKYMGMEVNELIEKWDAARDFGTRVHSEIESYLNDQISPATTEAAAAIDWLDKYKMKSDITIHSEVRIFSKELKLAGTIDIIAHDKSNDVYEIIDWKTSKSIDTQSYKGKMGTHQITSHLMDCNFVHYSLQLSFYRYLLEEYYGLKVNNQLIAHLDKSECVAHVADYHIEVVNDIINSQKD